MTAHEIGNVRPVAGARARHGRAGFYASILFGLALAVPTAPVNGQAGLRRTEYAVPGRYDLPLPSDATLVRISCWGGGGGGGRAAPGVGGGGGGGGAYQAARLPDGATGLVIVVGQGGASGASGTESRVEAAGQPVCQAGGGGGGGRPGLGENPGYPGAVSGGSVGFPGGRGGDGYPLGSAAQSSGTPAGGGGGASGSQNGPGGEGQDASGSAPGAGGSSQGQGGSGGGGARPGSPAASGMAPGGGGGGGATPSAAGGTPRNGGNGLVVVEYAGSVPGATPGTTPDGPSTVQPDEPGPAENQDPGEGKPSGGRYRGPDIAAVPFTGDAEQWLIDHIYPSHFPGHSGRGSREWYPSTRTELVSRTMCPANQAMVGLRQQAGQGVALFCAPFERIRPVNGGTYRDTVTGPITIVRSDGWNEGEASELTRCRFENAPADQWFVVMAQSLLVDYGQRRIYDDRIRINCGLAAGLNQNGSATGAGLEEMPPAPPGLSVADNVQATPPGFVGLKWWYDGPHNVTSSQLCSPVAPVTGVDIRTPDETGRRAFLLCAVGRSPVENRPEPAPAPAPIQEVVPPPAPAPAPGPCTTNPSRCAIVPPAPNHRASQRQTRLIVSPDDNPPTPAGGPK